VAEVDDPGEVAGMTDVEGNVGEGELEEGPDAAGIEIGEGSKGAGKRGGVAEATGKTAAEAGLVKIEDVEGEKVGERAEGAGSGTDTALLLTLSPFAETDEDTTAVGEDEGDTEVETGVDAATKVKEETEGKTEATGDAATKEKSEGDKIGGGWKGLGLVLTGGKKGKVVVGEEIEEEKGR
jgi:hypothetical protein